MAWVAVIGAGGAIAGGLIANKGSKDAAKAQDKANAANAVGTQADPRIANMLFGSGQRTLKPGVQASYDRGPLNQGGEYDFGAQNNPESDYMTDGGLLGQYQALGRAPQNAGLLAYGQQQDAYLGANSGADMQRMRDAAGQMMGASSTAPSATAADASGPRHWAVGNQVQAPGQNAMDLSGSYDKFINGTPGANPFLQKQIQGGIDMSKLGFQQMQGAATENLMENILPGIRSNAVLAGQYGGSRQGVAEGNAIGDNQKAMQQAAGMMGQNSTNAAVGAQVGAYETDSNRALAATQGLGAQQYGVAQANAQTKNMAEMANIGRVDQFQLAQAGMNQQTNLANLGAQQQTNALDSSNRLAGMSAYSGLLGTTLAGAQNQDSYAMNRASQQSGLLAPYLSNTAPQVQPTYSNTAGNVLGGAMAGASLGQTIGGFFNKQGGQTGNPMIGNPATGGYGTGAAAGGGGTFYDGYGWGT